MHVPPTLPAAHCLTHLLQDELQLLSELFLGMLHEATQDVAKAHGNGAILERWVAQNGVQGAVNVCSNLGRQGGL